jgi:hypothetical protein
MDAVVSAYNARQLDRLVTVLGDGRVLDPSANPDVAVEFSSITEWAEAGWAVDDKLSLEGYGLGGDPSTLFLRRTNNLLTGRGIEWVSVPMHIYIQDCELRLESTAILAHPTPCLFFTAFADIPDVKALTPDECADGIRDQARAGHVAVWSGQEMLVWGGSRGSYGGAELADGLAYDPANQELRTIPPIPVAVIGDPFFGTSAVWTGEEMIVWGKTDVGNQAAGAAYNPESRTWRPLSSLPAPRHAAGTTVWTNEEMLVWGGDLHFDADDGWAYDPGGDSWRPLPESPLGPRHRHSAVWTGEEMIIWGGGDIHRIAYPIGAAYNPDNNSWRSISEAPIGLEHHSAVWTGEEMIVWGGDYGPQVGGFGAAYDPDTDTWRTLPDPPIPGRSRHTATWTGVEMLVWGGYDPYRSEGHWADGAGYNPQTDTWRELAAAPLAARCDHTAIWTGTELIILGGQEGCGSPQYPAFGDGASYDPTADAWTPILAPKTGK